LCLNLAANIFDLAKLSILPSPLAEVKYKIVMTEMAPDRFKNCHRLRSSLRSHGCCRWRSYRIGDVLVARGNLPEALKSFRDGLAIRDRLAKADRGNAGWQRDLSESYAKLASAYLKAEQRAKAGEALAAGRTIIARLVAQFLCRVTCPRDDAAPPPPTFGLRVAAPTRGAIPLSFYCPAERDAVVVLLPASPDLGEVISGPSRRGGAQGKLSTCAA